MAVRIIFALTCMLGATWAGAMAAEPLPAAPPLHPSAAFTPAGPAQARGALVWLHGAYDTDSPPPAEPPVLRRFAAQGWDIWRFDRTTGRDPIGPGGEQLSAGLRALHAAGYGHVLVAGHSRGAFIALYALRDPELADRYLLFSPAAHGSRPSRHAQAIGDFSALLDAAAPAPRTRLAIVQFADDPLDPDPALRLSLLRDMARRTGIRLHSLFQPPDPRGHDGVYDGDFARLFGRDLSEFLSAR